MAESSRWVICAGCGRNVNASETPVYFDAASGLSYCENCRDKVGTAQPRSSAQFQPQPQPQPQYRSAPPKKRRTVGSVLRIGFAILFIACALQDLRDFSTNAFFLIGAAVLLLWQFWPNIRQAKAAKAQRALAEQQREDARQAKAAEAARKRVCPHCGASSPGVVCEYCGMSLDK